MLPNAFFTLHDRSVQYLRVRGHGGAKTPGDGNWTNLLEVPLALVGSHNGTVDRWGLLDALGSEQNTVLDVILFCRFQPHHVGNVGRDS